MCVPLLPPSGKIGILLLRRVGCCHDNVHNMCKCHHLSLGGGLRWRQLVRLFSFNVFLMYSLNYVTMVLKLLTFFVHFFSTTVDAGRSRLLPRVLSSSYEAQVQLPVRRVNPVGQLPHLP